MTSSGTSLADSVLSALRQRRSIRKYTSEPVSNAQIAAILEAGRWAPSANNRQPCRFIVIPKSDPRHAGLAGQTKDHGIVEGSQVIIGVLLDRSATFNPRKDHQTGGACLQNILLACHALGLGAVWLGEIINQEEGVLKVLGLSPEQYETMGFVAIGHPAEAGHAARHDMSKYLLEPFPAA